MLKEDKKSWNALKEKLIKRRTLIAKSIPRIVEKFMGSAHTSAFFEKYCSELKLTLNYPIMKRLQELSNTIEKEIRRIKGKNEHNTHTRFQSHVYTNLLSCVVSLGRKDFTHEQLRSEGWKFGRDRYTSARKRQLEKTYVDLCPRKRERIEIAEGLQEQIKKE